MPDAPHHEAAGCELCGDTAVTAEVIERLDGGMARVRSEGCELEVAVDLVGDIRTGDRLLVHLGFAIARLEDA